MKKFFRENKKELLVLLYCFIVSFIILMFTSKNSFLYPFNDWVDANSFFTVGKGMVRGIVPYKDIFEQKGPFLYLIYGIASFISYKSFLGVFILEIIFWTVALYFLSKILKMFVSIKSSLIIIPLFTVFLTTTFAFTHGGSAEEFCLPLFMITMYYFFKHFKITKLTKKEMLINGIIAGLILLIKFTLLGYWIGFTFAIFIDYILDKDYKNAIIYPLVLLLGMFIPFTLFLIYFALNHGVGAFFKYYFFVNINSYAEKVSVWGRLQKLGMGIINTLSKNPINFAILIAMIIFIWKLDVKKRAKVLFLIMFFLTIFFVFVGLKFYRYYVLFVLLFASIGLLIIFNLFDSYLQKLSYKIYIPVLLVTLSLIICGAYNGANYKYFRKVKKDDLFQYEFADIMSKTPNATMVNMGKLDCGVYTTSGILPNTFFFEHNNIPHEAFPDLLNDFKKYIINKDTMYIVYFDRINLDKLKRREPELFENYELIRERTQQFEGKKYHAYLFKAK